MTHLPRTSPSVGQRSSSYQIAREREVRSRSAHIAVEKSGAGFSCETIRGQQSEAPDRPRANTAGGDLIDRTHLLARDDDALAPALVALEPAVDFFERVVCAFALRDGAVVRPERAVVEEGKAKVEEADPAAELRGERGGLADRREEGKVERERVLCAR